MSISGSSWLKFGLFTVGLGQSFVFVLVPPLARDLGLSEVQRVVVARLTEDEDPASQAQLARDLGRSRASVHSAISVLRKRGILDQTGLSLAPHLNGLRRSKVEYPWLDIRVDCS